MEMERREYKLAESELLDRRREAGRQQDDGGVTHDALLSS